MNVVKLVLAAALGFGVSVALFYHRDTHGKDLQPGQPSHGRVWVEQISPGLRDISGAKVVGFSCFPGPNAETYCYIASQ